MNTPDKRITPNKLGYYEPASLLNRNPFLKETPFVVGQFIARSSLSASSALQAPKITPNKLGYYEPVFL